MTDPTPESQDRYQSVQVGEVVDALTHPLALQIRDVLTNAERAGGLILIDDEENILQALGGRVNIQYVCSSGVDVIGPRLRAALPLDIPVHALTWRTAKKLFGTERASRVFAVAQAPLQPDLESLAVRCGDLVVLDGLSLAGNVGAIMRTAAALGASGVVLLNSSIVNVHERRLIRASRGVVFSLPVVTTSSEMFLRFCQRWNVDVLITSPHARVPVHEFTFLERRLALVLGSEKVGCSPALMRAAHWQGSIPMVGSVESLNVSAAASILLYCRRHFNAGCVGS